jgi:hypothetical protein
MNPQKRIAIVTRLAEITRELERVVLAPLVEPHPRASQKLRDEQAELECSLKSDGSDSSS